MLPRADQRLRPGAHQQVAQFVEAGARPDADDRQSGLFGRHVGDVHVDPVGHLDADPVAARQAETEKSGGEAIGALGVLGPGQHSVAAVERRRVRNLAGVARDHMREGFQCGRPIQQPVASGVQKPRVSSTRSTSSSAL